MERTERLAGPIALLKLSCSHAAHKIADKAVQIWGGHALTETRMGRFITKFNRHHKFDAVPGGADEIMADLGVKQVMRNIPKSSRL
ncbi:hypothetical protein CDD81_635 [Ophiocordyceps australis]|uniref:Acyl-CoA dehydrogenase/oxidase C-terminal domain-containing protein n=1 Tax=Ophiocordyceps australis TaxID=1399860 RepID=A0A2C5XXS3_9HYPO|nr:hypothetical protein CDD81_635 [Ophiocordyceps australis]